MGERGSAGAQREEAVEDKRRGLQGDKLENEGEMGNGKGLKILGNS